MVTLAFAAYSGFLQRSPDKAADEVLHSLHELSDEAGPHEVIWGPAVNRDFDQLFNDALMVLLRPLSRPGEITLVIRGTNPVSLHTWLEQNFEVEHQVPWRAQGAPAGAAISRGNHLSLSLLTGLQPEGRQPGGQLTILEAIQQEVDNPRNPQGLTINITGHSLGGVMASTLSLWLKEQLGQVGSPAADAVRIRTYSFAGPTAGNAAFAQHCAQVLGSDHQRIHNPMDVATLAWDEEAIDTIPSLYSGCFDPWLLDLILAQVQPMVRGRGYTQAGGGIQVGGQFYSPLCGVLIQAIHQHIFPYLKVYRLDVLRILSLIGFPGLVWDALRMGRLSELLGELANL